MASIIKTLKTYLTNKTIYPRTVTQAVYDSEGKRLDTILGKTDISAISDGTVTGAIAAVSNKADKNEESIITVEAIAKGRNQARVFSTTESMENWLSDSANKGVANVGDNLYIVAVDVPDWWISSVLEAPNESGMYYEIAQLETQKVDLTTIENAINSIDSKIGSTDISSIGDGTVTGGLDALNSNLGLINKKTFLWETSSNQGSKQIDLSPFSYVLIMISISVYATQCMIVPTYLKSLSALGIQTQLGLYSQNEYVYANITYDGTTFSFTSNKTVLFDVIGIQ